MVTMVTEKPEVPSSASTVVLATEPVSPLMLLATGDSGDTGRPRRFAPAGSAAPVPRGYPTPSTQSACRDRCVEDDALETSRNGILRHGRAARVARGSHGEWRDEERRGDGHISRTARSTFAGTRLPVAQTLAADRLDRGDTPFPA